MSAKGQSAAMQAQAGDADLRTLWLAQLTALCMTLAALCELVPWGTADIGRLPGNVIAAAQALVHELAEDCARSETARGIRARRQLLQRANIRLWELLKPFRPRQPQPHDALDSDPYETPESTREWCAWLKECSTNTALLTRIAFEAFKARMWAEGRDMTDAQAQSAFHGTVTKGPTQT